MTCCINKITNGYYEFATGASAATAGQPSISIDPKQLILRANRVRNITLTLFSIALIVSTVAAILVGGALWTLPATLLLGNICFIFFHRKTVQKIPNSYEVVYSQPSFKKGKSLSATELNEIRERMATNLDRHDKLLTHFN